MDSSVRTRDAREIAVHRYHQILIWPLLLKQADIRTERRQFEAWLERLKPVWGVPQPMRQRLSAPPDTPEYEEIIYFHPFVRDFLYGDGEDNADQRALVRLRRDDVQYAEITLADNDGTPAETLRLTVRRVELYLCKPLVALLVVEVEHNPQRLVTGGPPLSLEAALKIQSQFRQCYPPYFKAVSEKLIAGNCPVEVRWLGARNDVLAKSDFDSERSRFAEFTRVGAEPPVASHWEWLLKPLRPFQTAAPSTDSSGPGFVQQIVDDRIPGMTYLAVDQPREISEGDFDRLTFCDIGGHARFPFSEEFLGPNRTRHSYDRFWRPTPDHDLANFELSTRYLCSAHQFVLIGRSGNEFFDDVLPGHFRCHYFRMALILHYQRAALLKFQDEMAEAVKLVRGQSPEQEFSNVIFRERVTYLQGTFLKFRTRSWFSEVSNQTQGHELFSWWEKLLGNELLFRQVDEASQRLYAALAEYETRELTKFVAVGMPLSIALALLAVCAEVLTPREGVNMTGVGVLIALAIASTIFVGSILGRSGLLGRRLQQEMLAIQGKNDSSHSPP